MHNNAIGWCIKYRKPKLDITFIYRCQQNLSILLSRWSINNFKILSCIASSELYCHAQTGLGNWEVVDYNYQSKFYLISRSINLFIMTGRLYRLL